MPADAIGVEPDVTLELTQRSMGIWPKYAIDTPRVETEHAEPLLEFAHVVAAHVRRAKVQVTVTKLPSGLYKRLPGVLVAGSGHCDATSRLKSAQCRDGRYAKNARIDTGRLKPCCAKPALQVADSVAPGAGDQWEDGRNSLNSWSSCPLPLAPTMRLASVPSLKTRSVGML
jgi:hypothetical protein